MKYRDFSASFLPHLKKNFLVSFDEKSSNDQKVVLRSSISSGIEAETFISEFSKVSNTKWIVRRAKAHYTKLVYRKVWICQFSSHRKRSASSRNFKCGAQISIKIKKLTEHTRKKDKFLALPVPFCCVITIDLTHTHLTNSGDTLKKLRVTDEVERKYFSYFEGGLNAMTAKQYHENKIRMNNNYFIDLSNSALNPSDRQVYYLYDKWRKMNYSAQANPSNTFLRQIHPYEEEKAGVDGLKRRNLKKTAIPSVNLPTSSESTYEYERSAKLKKTEKSKFKEETPINKILIENTRKDTCFPDEMDSHESFESLEEIGNKLSSSSDEEHMPIEDTEARIGNEIPLSSDEEYLATEYTEARIGNETSLSSDEEHVAIEDTETRNKTSPNSTDNVINSLDTSPNFTNSIKAPKYSDTEDISVDSNKNCIIPHSTVKGNCDFDFSLFKSDSKEILTQKLETALSVNAALQKKLEFYQNKCRTYEKEVKILKGVVDNLKLINSVAPDY